MDIHGRVVPGWIHGSFLSSLLVEAVNARANRLVVILWQSEHKAHGRVRAVWEWISLMYYLCWRIRYFRIAKPVQILMIRRHLVEAFFGGERRFCISGRQDDGWNADVLQSANNILIPIIIRLRWLLFLVLLYRLLICWVCCGLLFFFFFIVLTGRLLLYNCLRWSWVLVQFATNDLMVLVELWVVAHAGTVVAVGDGGRADRCRRHDVAVIEPVTLFVYIMDRS